MLNLSAACLVGPIRKFMSRGYVVLTPLDWTEAFKEYHD